MKLPALSRRTKVAVFIVALLLTVVTSLVSYNPRPDSFYTYQYRGLPMVYHKIVNTNGICIGVIGEEDQIFDPKDPSCGIIRFRDNYVHLALNFVF